MQMLTTLGYILSGVFPIADAVVVSLGPELALGSQQRAVGNLHQPAHFVEILLQVLETDHIVNAFLPIYEV